MEPKVHSIQEGSKILDLFSSVQPLSREIEKTLGLAKGRYELVWDYIENVEPENKRPEETRKVYQRLFNYLVARAQSGQLLGKDVVYRFSSQHPKMLQFIASQLFTEIFGQWDHEYTENGIHFYFKVFRNPARRR